MGKIVVASTSGLTRVPFTFVTASPLVLGSVVAGQAVERAFVLIETPFDQLGATISLGTSADPGLVLAAADVSPSMAGQYETDFYGIFPIDDLFELFVNPNGSTVGAGLLLYKLS